MLAILCVTLSLALFALGGADSTGGFFLRTLSFASPLAVIGLVWDLIVVSRAVIACVMCEEYGRGVNSGLLHPLLRHVRVHPLYLLDCDTVGL
jgi:hypothetical protein